MYRVLLRGRIATALVIVLAAPGIGGKAQTVRSAPEAPVTFYSTAAPPIDYPGPIPVSSVGADPDPFSGTAPAPVEEATATAEPSADPDESPSSKPDEGPSPAPAPAPEAPADHDAEPDPGRLASNSPADRLVRPLESPPAPEAGSLEADPIARAKGMIAESKRRYETIRDYTCTFIKRERIDGRLSGYAVMTMKARTTPLSVYFKFRQPNAGREAIYVHGRDGGKAIVHDVGFGKLFAGTVRLDPRSRRAMDGNRHPITEAGIGFLIDTLIEGWHREMNPLDSEVTIRDGVLVNKRPTTMIICTHPRREKRFVFHEVRVYIDRELGLPIRFEAYDWPRRPGEAPPLLEEYTYADLRLNVGLSEHDFDPSNKAYSFGRF
ncbi:DUF1571 domain-containing protein [Tautonia sociabilis]|nr:DUF1571 domain-containing protein [Tautonia sociabilis]